MKLKLVITQQVASILPYDHVEVLEVTIQTDNSSQDNITLLYDHTYSVYLIVLQHSIWFSEVYYYGKPYNIYNYVNL